jgi:hypothetical protein
MDHRSHPGLDTGTFLTLSTGHLALSTREMLTTTPNGEWPVAGLSGDTGYFIYCHDEFIDRRPVPLELRIALEFGRLVACVDYVLFDRDGLQREELAYFGDGDTPERWGTWTCPGQTDNGAAPLAIQQASALLRDALEQFRAAESGDRQIDAALAKNQLLLTVRTALRTLEAA